MPSAEKTGDRRAGDPAKAGRNRRKKAGRNETAGGNRNGRALRCVKEDFMTLTDTIAAVSTPRGKGGVALIRVSGTDARAVLSRVFRPHGKAPVENPRRMCFGEILGAGNEVIDEGLCCFFPAPASFTGEDVAEISCHGGVLLTETVLSAVLTAGARMAGPGEFTRRALLNGKMDLPRAEALGALLDAGTAAQMALARGGMAGNLSRAAEAIHARLGEILSDVYAKIDFPDEDLATMDRPALTDAFEELRARLSALSDTFRTGRAVMEGIETVIAGPVNAGKSTLFNALVGRDAAIVTACAGTTRDLLSETVALSQVTLRLTDSAGLRDCEDPVEKIGVARARTALSEAELVLAVVDGSHEPDGETRRFLASLRELPGKVILLLNKADRGRAVPDELLSDFPQVLSISAASGDLSELRALIGRLFASGELDLSHDPVVANARQHAALTRAKEALDETVAALRDGVPLDAAVTGGEAALSALCELSGQAVSEEIVAGIFAHFCVGK